MRWLLALAGRVLDGLGGAFVLDECLTRRTAQESDEDWRIYSFFGRLMGFSRPASFFHDERYGKNPDHFGNKLTCFASTRRANITIIKIAHVMVIEVSCDPAKNAGEISGDANSISTSAQTFAGR